MSSKSQSSGSEITSSEVNHRGKTSLVNDSTVLSSESPKIDSSSKKKDAESQYVMGHTPDGTIFKVPETHDMVSNLLDPRVKKSISDIAIVSVLLSYVGMWFVLPQKFRVPVFLLMFTFWRAAYNAGIGYLLSKQSKERALVQWAKQYKIFEKSDSWVHMLVKKDLTGKLGPDYDFYKTPVEYNTWLLFRDLVDLILMSDFTCYMLLAFSCSAQPDHSWYITLGRWSAGIILFLFNLWVKLDAHRVVKDYAWYWGDFFFLEELQLTFDGVFEMAPHPMYSVGYAGFYGISLMTASYTMFFVSILAHAAQFAFLIIVENPHIEKTYNPPQAKSRKSFSSEEGYNGASSINESDNSSAALLIFKNFSIIRMSDILLFLLTINYSLVYFAPHSKFWTFITFTSALGWRLFHNFGLGCLLIKQSESKAWTQLFLKFGSSAKDAYTQWQALYNVCTVMSYVTFGIYCLREWTAPSGVFLWPFKYIIGLMLVSLQIWTSYSIFESLGEYGWFFGDFFYTLPNKQLTYSGIYRYLNNPERLFGIAGVWGMALLCNSSSVTFMAFIWTFGNLLFIRFVEQPHMQKLYGKQIRKEAGITKTIRQATKSSPFSTPLESKVRRFQGSLDKVISETTTVVEGFLDQARPKINEVVSDTRVLLKQYPARLTIVRLSDDIQVDTTLYGLKVSAFDPSMKLPSSNSNSDTIQYQYGTPLRVEWTADSQHSKKDWIGLYRLTDNVNSDTTRISSKGRWSAIDKSGYADHIDSIVANDGQSGEVLFSGDMLFWERGVYEFRYHYNGKHNVLAISQPFEIVTIRKDITTQDAKELADQLLPLVAKCYAGSSTSEAPELINEEWDTEDPKVVARIAYGIKEIYGIDLAKSVIRSHVTVLSLCERLISVKNALRSLVSE